MANRYVFARRLLSLAELLDHVKPSKFDMRSWCEGGPSPECGTTACAAGWATTLPWAKRIGFKLVGLASAPFVSYKDAEGFFACSEVFGVGADLFVNRWKNNRLVNDTPKKQAKFIRSYVRDILGYKGTSTAMVSCPTRRNRYFSA